MNDNLGNRMKEQYENRTKFFLPRRTYSLIRIDGKAFHTYTKCFEKPFDEELMHFMNKASEFLCKEIQGAKFAYVQSDEISILVTDFDNDQTEMWFNGNIQKICSISASMATMAFNKASEEFRVYKDTAMFDSRVFTIPDIIEVENYFIWRQKDCIRNSVSMVAQSLYSHKELQGKSCNEMQEMIFQKGINWNNYDLDKKRGRVITKQYSNEWLTDYEIPEFTQDRSYLRNLIPEMRGFNE